MSFILLPTVHHIFDSLYLNRYGSGERNRLACHPCSPHAQRFGAVRRLPEPPATSSFSSSTSAPLPQTKSHPPWSSSICRSLAQPCSAPTRTLSLRQQARSCPLLLSRLRLTTSPSFSDHTPCHEARAVRLEEPGSRGTSPPVDSGNTPQSLHSECVLVYQSICGTRTSQNIPGVAALLARHMALT